jgi:hypothetical protein
VEANSTGDQGSRRAVEQSDGGGGGGELETGTSSWHKVHSSERKQYRMSVARAFRR